MESLFGHLCSSSTFYHDRAMESLWRARPFKESQIQGFESAEKGMTDEEGIGATSSQLTEIPVSGTCRRKSEDATLHTNIARQDVNTSLQPPKKKVHRDMQLDQRSDCSFQDRVHEIKHVFDDEPEDGPSTVTEEIIAVITRSLTSQPAAQNSCGTTAEIESLATGSSTRSQALVHPIHHHRALDSENRENDDSSLQAGYFEALDMSDDISHHDKTRLSLGSRDFQSPHPLSQIEQFSYERQAYNYEGHLAFKPVNGDCIMDWAFSGPVLHCVGDNHTTPEVELG